MSAFSVRRIGRRRDAFKARYRLTVEAIPDRSWAYPYEEMRRELMVLADMNAVQARSALFTAYMLGEFRAVTR